MLVKRKSWIKRWYSSFSLDLSGVNISREGVGRTVHSLTTPLAPKLKSFFFFPVYLGKYEKKTLQLLFSLPQRVLSLGWFISWSEKKFSYYSPPGHVISESNLIIRVKKMMFLLADYAEMISSALRPTASLSWSINISKWFSFAQAFSGWKRSPSLPLKVCFQLSVLNC